MQRDLLTKSFHLLTKLNKSDIPLCEFSGIVYNQDFSPKTDTDTCFEYCLIILV